MGSSKGAAQIHSCAPAESSAVPCPGSPAWSGDRGMRIGIVSENVCVNLLPQAPARARGFVYAPSSTVASGTALSRGRSGSPYSASFVKAMVEANVGCAIGGFRGGTPPIQEPLRNACVSIEGMEVYETSDPV